MDGATGRSRRLTRGLAATLMAVTTLVAIAVTAPPAQAVTINVACPAGVGDVTALRAAITTANGTAAADVIDIADVDPCVFTFTNTAAATFGGIALPAITQPLTIEGHGAVLERSGATNMRILYNSTGALTLRDLTVRGGRLATSTGAGILSQAALTLERVTVSDNDMIGTVGSSSAGIASSAAVTVTDSLIQGNDGGAFVSGLGVAGAGPVSLSGSTVDNNDSAIGGAGGLNIQITGVLSITNSTISGNNAPAAGGVFSSAGTTSISGSTISANGATVTNGGGGISTLGGTVTITSTQVTGNTAPGATSGGGIRTQNSVATVSGSTIASNTANGANSGGGIYATGGSLSLTTSGVNTNGAAAGGSGGGVRTQNAGLTVDTVVFNGNSAGSGSTGGLSVGGSTTPVAIDDSTFQFNAGGFTTGSGSGTGALTIVLTNAAHSAEVRGNAFFLNGGGGAGVATVAGGTTTFRNNTLTVNSANGGAGGIVALNFGTIPTMLDVENNTITDSGQTGNTAPSAAVAAWEINTGLGIADVVIDLVNNIFTDLDSAAANVAPSCTKVAGTEVINDNGGNLEWPNDTCGFDTVANPQLAPIALNGGPTLNYRLLPTSPAIDLGVAPCPSVDQRGATRPDGDACDSGSYEAPLPETEAAGPVGTTNDPTPDITFSSPDTPGATFECSVDGGDFAVCTSPFTTPTLDDDEHTVEVRAVSSDGYRDPSPASVTFTVDTTPPVVEIGTVESPTTDTTPSVPFTVDDEEATTQCQIDDDEPVDCGSPFTTPALADGTYTITVIATDEAGNTGTDSVDVTVDTTDPIVTIDDPTSPTGDATPSITFSVDEEGTTIECSIDGEDFVPCSSPFEAPDALDDGTHTFTVRATDGAGNQGEDSVDIEVDTTGPSVTIDDPTTPTSDNTPSIAFTGDEDAVTFECQIDTGDFVDCDSPFTTPTLPDGPHSITVRALDALGNTGPTDSVTILIDAVAPDTTITAGPSGTIYENRRPRFQFVSDTPGSTFECSIDGGDFETCTSPHRPAALSAGPHTFAVRAVDVLTVDLTPATRSFTIQLCTIHVTIGGVTVLCL